MNKRGFVMIETIIVISVLSIGLISLYSSYALILNKTTSKSKYDNSEYIYKAYFISKNISVPSMSGNNYLDITGTVPSSLKNIFGVDRVYLTKMSTELTKDELLKLDGSTIDYVRSLKDYDTANTNIRLIVKFKNETEYDGIHTYCFANIEIV